MGREDRQLVGVGGWLAVFAFGVGALTPLRLVIDLSTAFGSGSSAAAAQFGSNGFILIAAEWTITLLTVALCWFMVWRLYRVECWSTVRIVIAGIWAVGLGRCVLEMLLFSFWLDMSQVMDAFAPEAGGPLLYGIVWTAYFLRSRRVANTYPRDRVAGEVAEIFS